MTSRFEDARSQKSDISKKSLERQSDLFQKHRFRGAQENIQNFFSNLTYVEKDKKSSKKVENIPFQLLMGNFRRKHIIDTIKNRKLSPEQRCEILEPMEELIEKIMDDMSTKVKNEDDNPDSDYIEDILEQNSDTSDTSRLEKKGDRMPKFPSIS
jgi:light-regulated signal transduction histidine kinase (bacteriophytochrome)